MGRANVSSPRRKNGHTSGLLSSRPEGRESLAGFNAGDTLAMTQFIGAVHRGFLGTMACARRDSKTRATTNGLTAFGASRFDEPPTHGPSWRSAGEREREKKKESSTSWQTVAPRRPLTKPQVPDLCNLWLASTVRLGKVVGPSLSFWRLSGASLRHREIAETWHESLTPARRLIGPLWHVHSRCAFAHASAQAKQHRGSLSESARPRFVEWVAAGSVVVCKVTTNRCCPSSSPEGVPPSTSSRRVGAVRGVVAAGVLLHALVARHGSRLDAVRRSGCAREEVGMFQEMRPPDGEGDDDDGRQGRGHGRRIQHVSCVLRDSRREALLGQADDWCSDPCFELTLRGSPARWCPSVSPRLRAGHGEAPALLILDASPAYFLISGDLQTRHQRRPCRARGQQENELEASLVIPLGGDTGRPGS
jgi:hypothetical protein